MKALTLTQPWASLVAIGEKRYETRSWQTPYRGPLAIHAAKGVAPIGGEKAFAELCENWEGNGVDGDFGPFGQALFVRGPYALPENLPRGAVVAIAELVDVLPTDSLLMRDLADGRDNHAAVSEHAFGDYSAGRFAWKLENVQRLVNLPPARGHQQIWDWGCLLDDVLAVLDGGPRISAEEISAKLGVAELDVEAAVYALLRANLCGEVPAGYYFTDQRDPATEERERIYKLAAV